MDNEKLHIFQVVILTNKSIAYTYHTSTNKSIVYFSTYMNMKKNVRVTTNQR